MEGLLDVKKEISEGIYLRAQKYDIDLWHKMRGGWGIVYSANGYIQVCADPIKDQTKELWKN